MDWKEIEKRKEEILKIFEEYESEIHKMKCDHALVGLQILSKYTNRVIQCAEHDIIYSIAIEDAIEKGITDEDCIELAKLNWMAYEGEYFACFV
jgi:hypothetical protein